MVSRTWARGVSSKRLWMVRQVTSTRDPPSGMWRSFLGMPIRDVKRRKNRSKIFTPQPGHGVGHKRGRAPSRPAEPFLLGLPRPGADVDLGYTLAMAAL